MSYRYSSVDKNNLNWFPSDTSKSNLMEIRLDQGRIRGLNPFNIEFNYPLSVIAGKNGSGKSTILALAACAFHTDKTGYKLPYRKLNYYTFSDFFIQTKEEIPPEGISVYYLILYNNWRKSKTNPTGEGLGWQVRKKRRGGKWNNYSRRARRNVVFFGIQRVVPHSEKSVSISYRHYFSESEVQGWESKVGKIVGRILDSKYDIFWMKEHYKYRLPMVKVDGIIYSGFNMGAGENALFDIFSTIFKCPEGALLIIDEIELGLHEKAQKKLIEELKLLCKERHIQIICTTHSPIILETVPPEGRFFVESFSEKTIVTPGISADFAGGKLAGENSNELDIFVEDGFAKHLVEAIISTEIRNRVNIIPIGSSTAVIRQLIARYKNIKQGQSLAILDGDKSSAEDENYTLFLKSLESVDDENSARIWVTERLTFLPGDIWPEKWILTKCDEINEEYLCMTLSITKEELEENIKSAILAGKHNEFYSLEKSLNQGKEYLSKIFSRHVAIESPESFEEVNNYIKKFLE